MYDTRLLRDLSGRMHAIDAAALDPSARPDSLYHVLVVWEGGTRTLENPLGGKSMAFEHAEWAMEYALALAERTHLDRMLQSRPDACAVNVVVTSTLTEHPDMGDRLATFRLPKVCKVPYAEVTSRGIVELPTWLAANAMSLYDEPRVVRCQAR